MSKFNKTVISTGSVARRTITTNKAGGTAYKLNKKLELATLLLSNFVADSYYESKDEFLNRLRKLVLEIDDKKFLAKAALYARNEAGMRSISHVLAGEIVKNVKGEQWTKDFCDKIVRRVDDMTEILAYLWSDGKTPIPNSLKKGFRKAFDKFDDYQLSKYVGNRNEIKLVDLVNLIHPLPTERNFQALSALADPSRKLVNATTSNRVLTEIGKKANSKEEKSAMRSDYWDSVISNKRIGYIDLLRQMTKVMQESPESVDKALEFLTNKNAVKKSLVLPFQVWTAIKMIVRDIYTLDVKNKKVVRKLSEVLDYSVDNIPDFDGETLVVVDYSGSMDSPVNSSNKSKEVMKRSEAGALMAMIFAKKSFSDFLIFGDEAKYIPINNDDSILSLMKYNRGLNNYRSPFYVGHGTSFSSIFKSLNKKYDRILVFSDMQGWSGPRADDTKTSYRKYCEKYSASPYLYMFDLAGHGTAKFPANKVVTLAGFSEKVFDLMEGFEADPNKLIKVIESVDL